MNREATSPSPSRPKHSSPNQIETPIPIQSNPIQSLCRSIFETMVWVGISATLKVSCLQPPTQSISAPSRSIDARHSLQDSNEMSLVRWFKNSDPFVLISLSLSLACTAVTFIAIHLAIDPSAMSLESTRRVVLLTNTFLFRRCEETGIDQVLLGEKLRGWRKGIFNGFGGKVEAGESIRDAALRELHEGTNHRWMDEWRVGCKWCLMMWLSTEAGVEALDLEQQGVFWQTFDDKPDRELEIHVFRATKWSGTISKTDEMEPRWFAYDDIPYHNMWKDDTYVEGATPSCARVLIWFPCALHTCVPTYLHTAPGIHFCCETSSSKAVATL